jgi:threonine synthase
MLTGLAPDGGLYVPESLPHFSREKIASFASLSYAELAFEIMQPFVEGCIPDEEFRAMVNDCYAQFRHPAVAPLVQLDHNEWVLELFQGPTLAFKDFALQLLGRLLDYVLEKRDQKVVIMGATSGDTGSAAIEGCRHCDNVEMFILHPHNRVSDVQRKQMTSVLADNIHNIALEGNFDDCQSMVKASFADQSFLPDGRQLVAVNSINWARIMAQIVYYFYAAVAVGSPEKEVGFSVPTGNFGDIFAGYLAKGMGLPINQLIVATNSNDILHRTIANNLYEKHNLEHTLSPSMDIMVSSNFERLLFDVFDRDGEALADFMRACAGDEAVTLPQEKFDMARELFDSFAVNDELTCATIAQVFDEAEYLLDPHSAIGVKAAREVRRYKDTPMITLATAHPAKFAEAALKSGQAQEPALPHHMSDLMQREERFTVLENNMQTVHGFMQKGIRI